MTQLVLIGPPGSGKSTVGKLVAQSLGVEFADTDEIVEANEGRAISEIFLTDGEDAFRAAEREAVAAALATHSGVLSLGGGSVLDSGTREQLATHRVIFLHVGLADAAKRVGLNTARPLLVGSPRRQWQELMDARFPIYSEVADAQVSTSGQTPEESRDAVLEVMRQW